MRCAILDVAKPTTCMNVICTNKIVSMVFNSLGLTPTYDILPYSLKGVMLHKLQVSVILPQWAWTVPLFQTS